MQQFYDNCDSIDTTRLSHSSLAQSWSTSCGR